jgi:replicative DNA helicase
MWSHLLQQHRDSITEIYEPKSKRNRFFYEERALMFCLLSDMEKVRRNMDVIHPYMFYDKAHSVLYQAMLDAIERGVKSFKPADLAFRMKEIDSHIDVKSAETSINTILSSDNDPPFYRLASKFWESWRNRECNRRLERAMVATTEEGDELNSSQKFEAVEEALELRKRTNPFAGRCKSAVDSVRNTLTMLEDIWSGKTVFPKVSTGYTDLDNLFDGGFDTGSFSVIGAATGHGKTASIVNMAALMAKQGTKVVFISLEESYRDVSMRLITSQSGVPRKHLIEKRLITDEEKARVFAVHSELAGIPDNTLQFACGGKTAGEIVDLIRLHHERDGSKVFFIDYMQRIQMEGDNRTVEVARFSLALGEIARELDLVIIGTSQLKREGRKEMSKRKPTTYDLSESSYLENEASYILTLFRQDLVPDIQSQDGYNPDLDGTIELICCKQRNGMQGSVWLNFDGPSIRVTPRVQHISQESQHSYYETSEINGNYGINHN